MKTTDLCRKHGISELLSTVGRLSTEDWKYPKPSGCGGLGSENARLKKLLADVMVNKRC
jgi:hypothetical protein